MRATRVPCEGEPEASLGCVDLEIPGIGVPVRPGEISDPWPRRAAARRVAGHRRAGRRPGLSRLARPAGGRPPHDPRDRRGLRAARPRLGRWNPVRGRRLSRRQPGLHAVPPMVRTPRRAPPRRHSSPTTSPLADGMPRPARWSSRSPCRRSTLTPVVTRARSSSRRRADDDGALAGGRAVRAVAGGAGARPLRPHARLDSRAMPRCPDAAVGRGPRARPRAQGAEDARFLAEHPRSAALLERGRAVMPNGVPMAWLVGSYHHLPMWVAEGQRRPLHRRRRPQYRDFNIADMSMFCGYAPEPLVRAVSTGSPAATSSCCRPRTRSSSPRSSAAASGCRSGSTRSSATHANTEAIRVARVVTGREKVLMFDGKYHGHFDEALVELDADGRLVPEERGLPADVGRRHRHRARSTTRRRSAAPSSGATSRSCSPSRRSRTTSACCCPTRASTPSSARLTRGDGHAARATTRRTRRSSARAG